MAQALVLNIDFDKKSLETEFSEALKRSTASWRVASSLDDQKVASVRKVALQQTANKLHKEFRICWTPGESSVRLIISEPNTAEEVEDALNTADPYILPAPTGAIITPDGVEASKGSIHWDHIEKWIVDTIRQYINTSTFLALGALRVMKDAG